MSIPADKKLYEQVSRQIKQKMPKHGAYRSGHIVQRYKQQFRQKHGPSSVPYLPEPRRNTNKGLSRWFREKWRNQRGEIGYTFKSDIYRPSIRITSKTPVTLRELSSAQIARARTRKYSKGRVARFLEKEK